MKQVSSSVRRCAAVSPPIGGGWTNIWLISCHQDANLNLKKSTGFLSAVVAAKSVDPDGLGETVGIGMQKLEIG